MSSYIKKESDREGIRMIRRGSPAYPERMQNLNGMPPKLFVKGSLPEDEMTVAIVGARRCSFYGKRQAEIFGRELARCGIGIISGMASGVDGAAQKGALEGGGRSYAVLGCGPDICYPAENRFLYEQLPLRGGLISEQAPGAPPLPAYFPARNRIISALADVVLVIEARKKSGSLITVDFALEQGKSVFALPGRVEDPLSEGCHALIAQGAGIAMSPQSVLDELERLTALGRIRKKQELHPVQTSLFQNAELSKEGLSPAARKLFSVLEKDPMTLDAAAELSQLPISEAACAMTELLLVGAAEEPYRNIYALPASK